MATRSQRRLHSFVPGAILDSVLNASAHEPISSEDFNALLDLVTSAQRLLVLTGAGCSTESGIPDYRDERGRWKRSAPVMLRDFVTRDDVRRRYWARSFVGWRSFGRAAPSLAHVSLARLEALGFTRRRLLTQNVDGLHQRAGSTRVIELHGSLASVSCLDCKQRQPRGRVQVWLESMNPQWTDISAHALPDGDAQLTGADWQTFRIPVCGHCGGLLKPDVVFFGETVPRKRVDRAMAELRGADGLLVVGSSLMVFSGFRFAREADRLGLPIGAINRGRTRADPLLSFKVRASCSDVLARVVAALS